MIATSIAERVATITLDAPATINAVSFPGASELADRVRALGESEDVDVIVLTGAGRVFSAGADLRAVGEAAGASEVIDYVITGLDTSVPALAEALLTCPVPVVAAVNGAAIGGAVGFALLADLTIAARSAFFELPQITTWGIVPDMGTTFRPVRRIGRAKALGMALLGDRISADEAEARGLIWRSVPDEDFEAEVAEVARRLARDPEAAVLTRSLIDAAPMRSRAEGLAAESQVMEQLISRPQILALLGQLAASV